MTNETMSRRRAGQVLLLASSLPWALTVAARPTDPAAGLAAMVRLDALYIPVLSLTSAAQADARAAPKAVAAAQRLRAAWPALQPALAAQPPSAAQHVAWRQALDRAGGQFSLSDRAIARADWAAAHEALESVRIELMQVRQAAGFDYFVDRLTAFHEPMEVLALAGAKVLPSVLDGRRRAELEQAYVHAGALWRQIERQPPDARQYRLSSAREVQLRRGLADETAALSRLSDALRGSDNAALLAAAKGLKPPFARVFTAFGLADGESWSD